MNATELLKTVPLGALIAFSDGTPRPPERFTKKLTAWKNTNGVGLLTEKTPGEVSASSAYVGRASFALRMGEYGGANIIVMRVNKVLDEASDLDAVYQVDAFHLYEHGADGVWRPMAEFILSGERLQPAS